MPLPHVYTATNVAQHFGVAMREVEEAARVTGSFARVGNKVFFTDEHVAGLLRHWTGRTAEVSTGGPAREERPFTPKTLAALWNVSAQQIRDLIRSGALPHFRVGRLMRIAAAAVREYERTHMDGAAG